MNNNKRIGISKKLRFTIFTRDNFTCRYCGRQSDTVVLEVDHLIPVCQGGTNDESNLFTSCTECNAGKGGRTIAQNAPTETDRLRLLQEHAEQLAVAKAASESLAARKEMDQTICNYLCEVFTREVFDRSTIKILSAYSRDHGIELVFYWIDLSAKLGSNATDKNIGKYISAIRRNYIMETYETRAQMEAKAMRCSHPLTKPKE